MKVLKTALIIKLSLIALIAAAVAGVVFWWKSSPGVDRVTMENAKIKDITPMVRLLSTEFYEDVPLKASVGPRHFFGKMTVTGSIGFDLENVSQDMNGDTIIVALPREIITIRESTDPDSYRVIDTWTDKLFGSSNFTTAEVNQIKTKIIDSYRRKLYAEGTVTKARKEAVENLRRMLETVTRRPVIVTDPSPKGYQ
uniref:DUF4230 domain-containing protein n=1 Tax=uncultured Muribaculaceae bacterium TaxID=2301481 RepID=A0A6G8F406_9BACT|nr:hypothetical protein Muribac1_0810 [uncultured Muribaculaceae bacterium]